MVLISHIYKFIYIKTEKTASSSVESFFGQFCIDPNNINNYKFTDKINQQISDFGIIGRRLNGPKTDLFVSHMNANKIKNKLGNNIFNNYFKFCVVRNPWDLMVSSYYWRKIQIPFNE